MQELQQLYDVLIRDKYYTKSFEDFTNQMYDVNYQEKVYDVIKRDKLFTKGKNAFASKYLSGLKSKKEEIKKEPTAEAEVQAETEEVKPYAFKTTAEEKEKPGDLLLTKEAKKERKEKEVKKRKEEKAISKVADSATDEGIINYFTDNKRDYPGAIFTKGTGQDGDVVAYFPDGKKFNVNIGDKESAKKLLDYGKTYNAKGQNDWMNVFGDRRKYNDQDIERFNTLFKDNEKGYTFKKGNV